MAVFSILVFFAVTLCLGYSVTRFVRESENFFERNLMRIGIGFGMFVAIGLLFNLIRVPLDYRIFLAISIIFAAFFIIKDKMFMHIKIPTLRLTKTNLIAVAVAIIFFATLYMYVKGAFSYPWLENDDPWAHAVGAKYVALEKTLITTQRIKYIDPYPPIYDMSLGILHQTNNSLYWTLKFFNALFISLSIIFFYFVAKEFTDRNKALFSTFALASVPAYLSHFIWAISLSVTLYFVAFYALERIKYDKRWTFIAAIMIGMVLTSSPTHGAYFGALFLIYYIIKMILERSILFYYAAAGIFGLLASFLLWWLPSILRHGVIGMLTGIGLGGNNLNIASIAGTGDRMYSWQDFFIAQKTNLINNPIGIGAVLSLLTIIAIVSFAYKYGKELKKNKFLVLAVLLAVITILLAFFSKTYVKYVEKKGISSLERGSVPFLEFFSDQLFLIAGISLILFVIVLLIIVNYKNPEFKERGVVITLAWLAFSFYAVNAAPFYYKLSPFRAWSILAIPLAIIASEGLWFLLSFFENFKIPRISVLAIAIVGIIITSSYQKYTVNTAQWPPGGFWTSNEEIKGYMWFKDNIPPNTKVFTFSNNGLIIGLDKFICHWCSDTREYQRKGFNETANQNYNWLKGQRYEYVIIDGQAAAKFGINETTNKLNALLASGTFNPVHSTQGFILLQIA